MSGDPGERWRRAGELFDELCELSAEQQRARLQRIGDEDPELAEEVRELLAADAREEGLLHDGAAAAAPELMAELAGAPPPDRPFPPPERIGPWRITAVIGRGGMGEVLLGERRDRDFQQKAAIKLLKRGMDSEQVLARFLQERRILARLNHPYIAKLIDGGLSQAGLPYFVMEYVDGVPITDYARREQLDLRARVRLMLRACEAVEYAHRNLVVHRDLKPSNVLVEADGTLKLLDFGIAKLLTDSQSEGHLTETGMRVMTPAYAAPEQVLGEPVTTATDVYALGVVLFELLTGQLPFRRPGGSVQGLAEAISRESIERPSVVLRRQSRESGVHGPRGREARALDADLDTIVLTALRREPERRYASAAAFAEDLRRWLDGRPVQARRDSAGYRFVKFVSRHRVGVAAASFALAALLIGFGVALWQAGRANAAAARAEAEARRAEEQARRALRTKDFLVEVIQQINPFDASRGAELSAAQLLEIAAKRVDERLADAPEAQAELRVAIGQSLYRLGSVTEARPLIDAGVAQLRAQSGTDPKALAEALLVQQVVYERTGDLEGSEALSREALGILQGLPGDHRREIITAMTGIAKIANLRGRYDEALRLHSEILAIRRSYAGPKDPDLPMDHQNLAADYVMFDRYADAEASYREAEGALIAALGPEHPRLAYVWHGLGLVQMKLGRFAEAEATLLRARAIQDRVLKPGDTFVANTRQVLSNLYLWMGDLERARAENAPALAHSAALDNATYPFTLMVRARIAAAEGAFAAVRADATLAAERFARHRGDGDALVLQARGYAAWGGARAGVVPVAAAVQEVQGLVERLEAGDRPVDEELAELQLLLADLHIRSGARGLADDLRRRARALRAGIYGADHPQVRLIDAQRADAS